MAYVRFEVPEDLQNESLAVLEKARETGKIKKGTNETTKALESGFTKMVYVATDVEPPEIVAHIPYLCEEKKAPYVYVNSKDTLGISAGLQVKCSAVAIVDEGEAKKDLDQLVKKLEGLKK